MKTRLYVIAALAALASLADGAAQRMVLRTGSIRMPAGSQHAARAAAHCVDLDREIPMVADSFNHFNGDISVTRTIGGKSETKPINEVLGKWVSARGAETPGGIDFLPLDSTADILIEIRGQKGLPLAGAKETDVAGFLKEKGEDLDKLLKALDKVSEDATKLHPELGKMADELRQEAIWDLPLDRRATSIPDAAELKETLRAQVGLPAADEVPEGLAELMVAPDLKGVAPDQLAGFFGYKTTKNEALKADLGRVTALQKDAAAINGELGEMSHDVARELAQEIIDGEMGAGKTAVAAFQEKMRSAAGLEVETVPSLKVLAVAARGQLGGAEPQALVKLLDLKVAPKASLEADILAMDAFSRSFGIEDVATRKMVDEAVSETALRALRGELPRGSSAKAALQSELRNSIELPEKLAAIELPELKVLLPDGLGQLNAKKLGELLGIRVTDGGSRKLVLLESSFGEIKLKGSESGSFESFEDALKSLKGKGADLELLVSEIPGPGQAKLLNEQGIHFVKHMEVFHSELLQTKTKPVKVIVVSSLDPAKAGKLFETQDAGILESIKKGTSALDEAARGGADIIIVDSREAMEKTIEALGKDVQPVLVLHNPGDGRIGFHDGDYDLMDLPDDLSIMTCDSHRLAGAYGERLVSTGLLDYEKLVKSVIDGAKKVGGAPAQDKAFFRAVEAGYRKGDTLHPGVTVAISAGGLATSGVIYMLLGGGPVAPGGEDPDEKEEDKDGKEAE